MFPEHKFPAASEDVAAVYTELLKQYKSANIGIYGCSAGGILTAQSVAWFQTHGLPRPGAIGIMCASAGGFGQGDSGVLWPLSPTQPRTQSKSATPAAVAGYLAGTDPKDPLVAPIFSPEVLRKFPPTLILTSTRAAESSAAAYTDVQLTKLGVASELHMWDGLGHGGYNAPDLPENKEADGIIVRFFDRHLGR
jgi:monoterpene epsilon-lactone hydrolase